VNATTAALVEQVKAHALEHYNDGGWDVLVECWSDEELAEVVGKKRTLRSALAEFAPLVSVWAERQADAVISAGEVQQAAPTAQPVADHPQAPAARTSLEDQVVAWWDARCGR